MGKSKLEIAVDHRLELTISFNESGTVEIHLKDPLLELSLESGEECVLVLTPGAKGGPAPTQVGKSWSNSTNKDFGYHIGGGADAAVAPDIHNG